jgi:hypothetical protein
VRLAPVIAVLAAVVVGCGSSPPRHAARPTPTPSSRPPTGAVTAAEESVIRGWADTLRHGDVELASKFFALPATVSNGGPAYQLRTFAAVRFFNETLPCGARLESTRRTFNGFVLATFVLTERPGEGSCGTGTGHRARTAFLIRRGKIARWIRAPDPPPPATEGPGAGSA